MKTLLLSLSMLLSNSLFAKTLIVSDIDDTVKVTDVLNKKNAVYNALFSKAAFSGMSELYQELDSKNSEDTIFYYVSGSPTLIEGKISEFLKFNEFPDRANLILKSGTKTPTYDYKVAAITKLIQTENPEKVILIGDDTEYDPEVYVTISKAFPEKVESIYIRAIRNKELPEISNIRNFFASTEIAGFELLKGNLETSSVVKVSTSFVSSKKGAKLAIKKRYCPAAGRTQIEELKHSVTDQGAISALEQSQDKIISTCSK